jgi:hypothetical protein
MRIGLSHVPLIRLSSSATSKIEKLSTVDEQHSSGQDNGVRSIAELRKLDLSCIESETRSGKGATDWNKPTIIRLVLHDGGRREIQYPS